MRASLGQLNMEEMILSNLLDILPPQSLPLDGNRPFSVDWHELPIFINFDVLRGEREGKPGVGVSLCLRM